MLILPKNPKAIRTISLHGNGKLSDGLSQGLNSAEVAQQLSITYNTVETHIKNIFHKLNVSNRHAMVAKAIKERLV